LLAIFFDNLLEAHRVPCCIVTTNKHAWPIVAKLDCDVDDAPKQTEKYNIMSVPSYIVIHKRAEYKRFTGSSPNVILGIEQSIQELSAGAV